MGDETRPSVRKLMQEFENSPGLASTIPTLERESKKQKTEDRTEKSDKDTAIIQTLNSFQESNKRMMENMTKMMEAFLQQSMQQQQAILQQQAFHNAPLQPAQPAHSDEVKQLATATAQVAEAARSAASHIASSLQEQEIERKMKEEKLAGEITQETTKQFKKIKDRIKKQLKLEEKIKMEEHLVTAMGSDRFPP